MSEDAQKIKVCFEGHNQRLFFSIKRTAKFKKAMGLFCKSANIPISEATFFIEGTPIKDSSTPQDVNLADTDVIDVFVKGDGGASYRL